MQVVHQPLPQLSLFQAGAHVANAICEDAVEHVHEEHAVAVAQVQLLHVPAFVVLKLQLLDQPHDVGELQQLRKRRIARVEQ